jgi:selenocysteine lyase/cysteine desulfurase
MPVPTPVSPALPSTDAAAIYDALRATLAQYRKAHPAAPIAAYIQATAALAALMDVFRLPVDHPPARGGTLPDLGPRRL